MTEDEKMDKKMEKKVVETSEPKMEKPKEKESEEKQKAKPKEETVKEKVLKAKKIVRLAATDLDGDKSVERAIKGIRGIGFLMANAIVNVTGLQGKKLGDLSPDERKKLEEVIETPEKFGIPAWILNSRKDKTGGDKHYVGTKLDFKVRDDIDFMKKIRSYKGVRHQMGLPVRGQRTRGSFRKGTKVGVVKKKELPARAGEKGEKK